MNALLGRSRAGPCRHWAGFSAMRTRCASRLSSNPSCTASRSSRRRAAWQRRPCLPVLALVSVRLAPRFWWGSRRGVLLRQLLARTLTLTCMTLAGPGDSTTVDRHPSAGRLPGRRLRLHALASCPRIPGFISGRSASGHPQLGGSCWGRGGVVRDRGWGGTVAKRQQLILALTGLAADGRGCSSSDQRDEVPAAAERPGSGPVGGPGGTASCRSDSCASESPWPGGASTKTCASARPVSRPRLSE
jgi:hypothetical protein